MLFKPILRRILVSDSAVNMMRPLLLGPRATVFMLHRFTHMNDEAEGISADALEKSLIFLRRNGYELISLADMLTKLRSGEPLPRFSVAFTVDDGYADFMEIGAPVFAKIDCPVTVFLATGFIDKTTWLWWDKVRHAFLTTPRGSCIFETGNTKIEWKLGSRSERIWSATQFAEELKRIPDATKQSIVSDMAAALDTEVPTQCPPEYRPMSWDDVRACEKYNIDFGPHTVTHPILSQVTDEVARYEIAESWRRVQQETASAVPIFCYPNGDPDSFGDRECSIAQEVGLIAAVTSKQQHLATQGFNGKKAMAYYQIPRFPYSSSIENLAQIVSGLEWLKAASRAYTKM